MGSRDVYTSLFLFFKKLNIKIGYMRTPTVKLKAKDILKSFQMDIREFHKNRVYLQHHLHIQPSEIDILAYYEYHWMLKDLVEMLEKQNGNNSNKDDADEKMNEMKSKANSYTKGFSKNNNLTKNFGNIKLPKF